MYEEYEVVSEFKTSDGLIRIVVLIKGKCACVLSKSEYNSLMKKNVRYGESGKKYR